MNKRTLLPLPALALLGIVACAAPKPQPAVCPEPSATPASAAGASSSSPSASTATAPGPLGIVGGEPIQWADLNAEVHADLRELDSSRAQRKLHLIWAGVESVIDARLFAAEAKKREMTVDELRATEIAAKVTSPSEEEVRELYDRNSHRIGVPFEVAGPHIRKEMLSQAQEQAEQRYIAELRESAEISYSLPVPPMPRLPVEEGGAPALGPAGAKVTLVEFSDFQCPYCAQAKRIIDDLRKSYPDDLRVVFRDFPLAQHPEARAAAEAAQCAHEQKKFWPYHDLLFANPSALAAADLERYADEVGLEVEAFKACLASERPVATVAAHEAAAERYGVDGTPALYLNGIKLIGLLPLPLMKALIDNELKAP